MKHFHLNIKNHMSFQKRLLIAFFSVAVPVLIIICIGLYIFLDSSARKNTQTAMLQALERTNAQLSHIISNTENLSRNIIYDSDVQKLLSEAAAGEAYPETEAVKYFINSFIVNRDYVESVVITGLSDTLFSTEKAYTDVSSFSNIKKKWWYPAMTASKEPCMWVSGAKNDSRNLDANQSLMLTRIIKSTQDYKTPVGRMMIYIKESSISEILDNVPIGTAPHAWVTDSTGSIMLKNSSAGNDIFKTANTFAKDRQNDSGICTIDGQSFVVGHRNIDDSMWQLIVAVPLNEVENNRALLFLQIFSMVLMVVITVVLISAVISATLSRPIRQIAQIMDDYHSPNASEASVLSSNSGTASNAGSLGTDNDGSKKIRELSMRPDEVGTISRSYEKMVDRVDTLIKEIYIKDLEKTEADLALLQSQINPHFLYNTLDSINWVAMANGQDEISEMVTALSDTFRLSLRRTNSPYIPISEEIEYLNSYLTLQKYRLGDKLTYDFHVPGEIYSLYILRFVLQPIIENSIKHGINHLENGGRIDVTMTVTKDGNCLEIHVINDGDNIDIEKTARLLAFDAKSQTFLSFNHDSYGLQNINRRIQIVHGSGFGICFTVTDDRRTDCRILLPFIDNAPETIK